MIAGREEALAKWFRLCTKQLQREFDQICYLYKIPLQRPHFEVRDSATFWGQWDPVTRKIAISKQLIEKHPWDIVLEILKHEIAHQYVTEVGHSDEMHGPYFREACARLAVADWARKAEGEIHPPVQTDEPENKNTPLTETRLIQRVQKLLALANSTNPNEAAAAMQKVQELYLKYNLDSIVEKREEECTYRLIRFRRRRLERFHYLACSILSDFYFVDVVYGSLFDHKDLVSYRTAEILGSKENVVLAEYVYYFLFQQAEHFWKSQKKNGSKSRSSFVLGVLSGFQEKLRTQKAEMVKDIQRSDSEDRKHALLVLEDDPRVEAFVKARYPKLHRFYRDNTMRDPSSFEAGREKGRDIVLHKPLNEGATPSGRLLSKK